MASSRFVGGPGTAAAAVLTLGICIGGVGFPTGLRTLFPDQNRLQAQTEPLQTQPPSFARMLQEQAETDRVWRAASVGYMQMTKIAYRSSVGDLDIPAFVFQPLTRTRRQSTSGDRLGSREHSRPLVRALHPVHP